MMRDTLIPSRGSKYPASSFHPASLVSLRLPAVPLRVGLQGRRLDQYGVLELVPDLSLGLAADSRLGSHNAPKAKQRRSEDRRCPCRFLVELRGFEPLTPSMRTRCATGLRYSPKELPLA
jgi:hypothetical protein